jgi:hypothetical protein
MSLMVEGIVDGGMDVEKMLRGSRRLEPQHLALSSPHDLVGGEPRLIADHRDGMASERASGQLVDH